MFLEKGIIGTCLLHRSMRQEHITLKDVEISELFDRIKKHLQEIKLDIIHEENEKDYWDLKAHKGSKGSIVVGNIRDVEVMISGTKERGHDLVLRTGAWGKDIIVPTAIATVATAGLATIPVALAEIYRAHAFEKHFWDFVRKETADIAKGKAEISSPVIITP
jgi:hypothetical protein